MAIIAGLMAGLLHPKIPLQIKEYNRSWPRDYNDIRLLSKMQGPRARIHYFLVGSLHTRYVISAGRNPYELSFCGYFLEEPFWLTLVTEAFCTLVGLASVDSTLGYLLALLLRMTP